MTCWLRPEVDGGHHYSKRSLIDNRLARSPQSAFGEPRPWAQRAIVCLAEACRVTLNFYTWIFEQLCACNPGCKPLSRGNSVQNIPHGPPYPASFAGYIRLAPQNPAFPPSNQRQPCAKSFRSLQTSPPSSPPSAQPEFWCG